MGGRHVQSPQQIQPTGESRYRHVRVRRRDARWRRRGSVIDADLKFVTPVRRGMPDPLHGAVLPYKQGAEATRF
jgi:hypothetical protein